MIKTLNLEVLITAEGKQNFSDYLRDRLLLSGLEPIYSEVNSYRSGNLGTYKYIIKPEKIWTDTMRLVLAGFTRQERQQRQYIGLSIGCCDVYTNAYYFCKIKGTRWKVSSPDYTNKMLSLIRRQIESIEEQFDELILKLETSLSKEISMSELTLRLMLMCSENYLTKSRLYDVYLRAISLSDNRESITLKHLYDAVSYELLRKGFTFKSVCKIIKLIK